MTKRTNKTTLMRGVRYLAIALPLAFIGPSVIYSAFNNQENDFYIPVLILGILACAGSVFLMFRGILTMVKALFDE